MEWNCRESRAARQGRLPGLLMAILVILSAQIQAEDKPQEKAQTWDVLYLGPQRIGYAHTTTQTQSRNGQTLIQTISESHLTFKRFGQTIRMQTILDILCTQNGELIELRHEVHNPPAQSTKMVGIVKGETLELSTTVDGRTTTARIPWGKDYKSPNWSDLVLQKTDWKAGDEVSFKTLVPDLNKISEVTITAGDMTSVPLLNENSQKLRELKMSQSVLPGMVTTIYINDQGSALKTSTGIFGNEMVSYQVPQEVALEAIVGEELDLAVQTLVKVGDIPKPYQTKRAVYRIHLPKENPVKAIPTGETQQLKEIDEHTAELTVTAIPLPEIAEQGEIAEEFLAPTRYLQCDDEAVLKHANEAVGEETDPIKMALLMEKYVYRKLDKKNFSTALASAGEVAKSLEGDCTEHAVLLAAMLRAKKIPSRIAVGLVYVRSLEAFGGHMWTEVRLGDQWVPLDATLGQGGIGATHIKLAHSSFADDAATPSSIFIPLMNIIGNIEIEVLEVK